MTPCPQSTLRRTTLVRSALVLGALILAAPSAARAGATTTSATTDGTTATTLGAEAPPELMSGLTATGATVKTPGSEPRTLDANQTTAFMQTWFAYSIASGTANEAPPAELPVSRLDVTLSDSGAPNSLLILYATDGTDAWVGSPSPVPGEGDKWIRTPDPASTIQGFEGLLDPIRVAQTPPTTAGDTTTTTEADGKGGSGGGRWPFAALAAVVLFVGGAVALRARRSSRAGRRR